MPKNFQKILVVNVNWLGDVVLSTAVFKALKEAYPRTQIACLAPPRVKEILESTPFVSEIILYDEAGCHKNWLGKLKLIGQLRQGKFDAVFILHRSLTRALFVFFAGIPIRVGYNTKGRGVFLTHPISEPRETLHRQDYYLRILEDFGISVSDRKSFLKADPSILASIEEILFREGIGREDFVIVLNPGGNWDLKRWPKENFTRLIERLLITPQSFDSRSLSGGNQRGVLNSPKNLRIVLSGAQKDVPLSEEILQAIPLNCRQRIVNLTGKQNLKELIALMKRANLVVSADSGPLHIASSLGTPTIAIFGPTDPGITGPRGEGGCQILKVDVGCNRDPCYYLDCPENICMRAVTVEDVFSKTELSAP